MESPNSCATVEVSLDEILSTSGGNSPLPCSHVEEVSPFCDFRFEQSFDHHTFQ